MPNKKSLIPVILSLGLITVAVVGGLSIYSAYNKSSSGTTSENTNGMETTISAVQGINIKRLSSGTDGNGYPYQVFSYETVPTYTKNACNVSLSFADNRNNPTDYLTISHDVENRQITVTCAAAFDSQATITFSSGTASATVTVDYQQKYLGITAAGSGGASRVLHYDNTKYNPKGGIGTDTHPSICDLLTEFYSSPLYVVNKSQTYTVALTDYDSVQFRGLSVPHGLGYTTYEDYIDTTNYSQTLTDIYTNFWGAAFDDLEIIHDGYGTDAEFEGIYKALNTVWNTLSDTQKQSVVTNCSYSFNGTSDIYLYVELPRIKNMTANVYFPDAARNDTYSFGKALTLYIEPMPSWNIGLNATSITPEQPGITF